MGGMGQDVGKCSSLMHGQNIRLKAEGMFLTCRHSITAAMACPCERIK